MREWGLFLMMLIGDACKILNNLDKKIQTWVVDPPYNIGFKYDNFVDRFENYENFIFEISKGMYQNTKEDGSFFFIHYPIDCARLLPIIESNGWFMHQWITWVYPSNIGMSKNKFTTAHRVILWFTKSKKPKFDHKVKGQFRNPNDKRIKKRIEEGKSPNLYDWWKINLCKNTSKDYKGYANQIPKQLLERIILNTTEKGDIVGDCCAGTGSTLRVAKYHSRGIFGCDINEKAHDHWRDLIESN